MPSALLFLLIAVLWTFTGLSQLGWRDAPIIESYAIRLPIGLLCLSIYFWFLVRWSQLHSASVRDKDRLPKDQFTDYQELEPEQLLEAITKNVSRFSSLGVIESKKLAKHLLTPEAFRFKVAERITVSKQQTAHKITVSWHKSSFVKAGNNFLVPVMRPYKGEVPRELVIENGRLLSSFETIALLYVVCLRLAHVSFARSRDLGDHAARLAILKLITDSAGPDHSGELTTEAAVAVAAAREAANTALHRRLRGRIFRRHPEPESAVLHELLSRRRPYIAVFGEEHSESTVSYRADRVAPANTPVYDNWRMRKDHWRAKWFPTRMVAISLERARSADSYQLYVNCDERLFVDEAEVWSDVSKRFMPNLTRTRNYKSYIGWDRPSGKAFVSLGAAKVRSAELKDLWFVLRLTEKPPGILGAATSVSFATLVAIWLVGAAGSNSSSGVNLVALILALPAVLSAALGLGDGSADHGFRSLTGICSLVVSMVLSLFGIGVFLSEHQHGLVLKAWEPPAHKFVYILKDGYWVVLFSLAACSFAITCGTLLLRLGRYFTAARGRTLEVN